MSIISKIVWGVGGLAVFHVRKAGHKLEDNCGSVGSVNNLFLKCIHVFGIQKVHQTRS